MLVDEQVNEAIGKAIDAAVFVNLVGEFGPHINKAAASAQMPVDEAINEAAESAWMLADETIDKVVDAAVFVKLGGEFGPLIDKVAATA
jgi:hypothetical protein